MDPNIPTQDQAPVIQNPLSNPAIQQPLSQQSSIPQDQTSRPINQIPSSKNKWKWILLIIVFLLIAGVGIYILLTNKKLSTSFQDETDSWKTYQNTRYNYKIKYPSSLNLYNEDKKFTTAGISPEESSFVVWNFSSEEIGTSSAYAGISTSVGKNTDKKSLISVLGYESGCKIETQEAAFARIDCNLMEGHVRTINSVFALDDKVYKVTFSTMRENPKFDFSTEINTYNKMLSTFKFTNNQ
jgi:hypothetical protein